MVTKLGRMVTYLEELLPTSHMTLWSRGPPRLRGKLKSSYLHYLSVYGHQTWQDVNSLEWVPTYKVTRINLWWLGLAKSREKLEPLYLHYHDAYDHQNWQNSGLPWADPTHKVTWSFSHVVLQDHVTI